MLKGSKHSAAALARMSESHKTQLNTRKGFKSTDETRERIRKARSQQAHPRLLQRGISKEQCDAAIAAGLRWCSGKCKTFIPRENFDKSSLKCRGCKRAFHSTWKEKLSPERRQELNDNIKRWRTDNPGYEKRYRLLATYGVTPEWYQRTLAEQSGSCALCYGATGASKAYFCVDHDHRTGKPRGLLCLKCNTALERGDNISGWLERAILYLRKHAEG